MLRSLLISSLIVLLACQGRYNRQRDHHQDTQIDNIVRFISDVQLYQINRENSRSRSLLFLPCSLDKVRGLKGVCRNLNKQRLPNTLYRLNQFLAKRKKYQNKRKIKEAEKIQKKKEKDDVHISENIIQDSELYPHEKIKLNQVNNISVDTSTKVVFINLTENVIHNETATELQQINEEEEEIGDVVHELNEETTTEFEKVLQDNEVDEQKKYETHEENTTELEQVLEENGVDEERTDIIHQETKAGDEQVLQDGGVDEGSGASGDEDLLTEAVTELIDESIVTVTDLPDEDSSIHPDLLDHENIIENSIEFEKIMEEEELIVSLTERIEDVEESSGEREDFEVNFP